jgi:hypothetical protein
VGANIRQRFQRKKGMQQAAIPDVDFT